MSKLTIDLLEIDYTNLKSRGFLLCPIYSDFQIELFNNHMIGPQSYFSY